MHLDYSAANAEDGAVLWWRRRMRRKNCLKVFFSPKNVPEHVEEAVPRLCHAVIVHLDGNQDGIFIGNFERWEGWTVGEAQQPGVGTVWRRRHLHSGRGRRPLTKFTHTF